MRGAKVLIVGDEPAVARMLEVGLQDGGYDIRTAFGGLDALALAREWQPDLVLLDVLLPDVGGHEVCRRLREFTTVPVLLLTGLRQERGAMQGLEVGADGYVTKPFSVAELRSQVRSALRLAEWLPERCQGTRLDCDQGRLTIDLVRRLVHRGELTVPLGDTQLRLLTCLAANPGRTLTYQEIAEQVWGDDGADPSTVRAHLLVLRLRVEDNPERPRLIALVDDVGAQFIGR